MNFLSLFGLEKPRVGHYEDLFGYNRSTVLTRYSHIYFSHKVHFKDKDYLQKEKVTAFRKVRKWNEDSMKE